MFSLQKDIEKIFQSLLRERKFFVLIGKWKNNKKKFLEREIPEIANRVGDIRYDFDKLCYHLNRLEVDKWMKVEIATKAIDFSIKR